jgi:ribosomal-protein-alanine N-acetyltransferase
MESVADVELSGARALVREIAPRDVETLLELASDPEVVRFTHWPARTREALAAFVARAIEARHASPRVTYALAIDERSSGSAVGFVRLAVTSVEHEQAELGAYLLRHHWRKGFATEVGDAMCAFAFDALRLHRLFCHCDVENVASLRTIEKLGFVREGTLRHRLRIDGVWRDSHLYAMVAGAAPLASS